MAILDYILKYIHRNSKHEWGMLRILSYIGCIQKGPESCRFGWGSPNVGFRFQGVIRISCALLDGCSSEAINGENVAFIRHCNVLILVQNGWEGDL